MRKWNQSIHEMNLPFQSRPGENHGFPQLTLQTPRMVASDAVRDSI
jgi:hypothetical protein